MTHTRKEQQDIDRKLKVLKYADTIKNISKACRYFGVSREAFYQWKRAYLQGGEKGLINSKPCPENLTLRIPADIEEKIIYLRTNYHLGQQRISWYLMRYHNIKVSSSGVYSVLKRNSLNRLPANQRKRSLKAFKRYEKQVPGHRIQVDVKFLDLQTPQGTKIRRYQYTAIDDAIRARVLKIYERHTQKNAIDLVDYFTKRFPFRIHTIQTDNGHEFQSQFHWHCEDLGIRHVYIKPRSPHLNGKVERSHGTDQQEFYQLINFTDDIDIRKKLQEWEKFYNCHLD
ncbi:IS481 family transposase [Candidatus Odyssella acanthamoebae]|uniref:IS481 family transposase n=1 Tax=Candidatus Odyssella acanthamoebae TaxID=91604 RepID=UPI00068E3606|nr:IS481 family transposase [Candidatus Paracaedibacter acanthamoebae]